MLVRYWRHDHIREARTGRVIVDDARGLLVWIPDGAPMMRAQTVAGERPRRLADQVAAEWRAAPATWRGPGVLMFFPAGGRRGRHHGPRARHLGGAGRRLALEGRGRVRGAYRSRVVLGRGAGGRDPRRGGAGGEADRGGGVPVRRQLVRLHARSVLAAAAPTARLGPPPRLTGTGRSGGTAWRLAE